MQLKRNQHHEQYEHFERSPAPSHGTFPKHFGSASGIHQGEENGESVQEEEAKLGSGSHSSRPITFVAATLAKLLQVKASEASDTRHYFWDCDRYLP